MEYQWVQEFLASPQLADVISYVFLIAVYLSLYFVKKFTQKENKNTSAKVDAKVAKLENVQAKMEASDEAHLKEREEWQKEKLLLQSQIKNLNKAVRVCSSNVKELVKSGISNSLAKMLPVEDDEDDKNFNISIGEQLEEKTEQIGEEE